MTRWPLCCCYPPFSSILRLRFESSGHLEQRLGLRDELLHRRQLDQLAFVLRMTKMAAHTFQRK